MQLTLGNRLKLCWEILTKHSGHKHSTFTKDFALFKEGYSAGLNDKKLNNDYRTPRQLKLVWNTVCGGVHHNFKITSPPVGEEVLVVHVDEESMNELLKADHMYEEW